MKEKLGMSDEEFSAVNLCHVDKGRMRDLPETFQVTNTLFQVHVTEMERP